jgi:U3 small nucleolar RNA-associated protein 6
MTAIEFTIPTINRCDIDNFCLSAIAIRENEKEEESSSPTIMDGDAITKAFEKYQALYLPQYCSCPDSNDENNKSDNGDVDTTNNILRWNNLCSIFENLNDSDKQSFCIENENAAKSLAKDGSCSDVEKNKDTDSSAFLKDPSKIEDECRVGYCSFMIQNDKKALSDLLPKLPVQDPVATAASKFVGGDSDSESGDCGWVYEPCLWIFFGRNNNKKTKDLEGRPEHTDQISHDGTWHYQLSGTKRWLLRPTPQLLRSWKQNEEEEETDIEPQQMRIDCRQGDVLIVNTRLWRHQTILPPQIEPSVSYARDFWIHKDDRAKNDRSVANTKDAGGAMTNVDGLYAMDDIAQDTVIFKEDDMPDCELHRTSEADKANCKIVELEDGMQAVVSSKFIMAGEFFCIPESSDEEDNDVDDEEIEGSWFEGGEEDDD